jgi:hypothetical protein
MDGVCPRVEHEVVYRLCVGACARPGTSCGGLGCVGVGYGVQACGDV